VIDAPAEDAWVVVGERFGQISEWASAITESVMDGPPSPFGHQVRRRRAIRRMSQLDLAAAAGTTPRHLSFVETGRSWPGKDLVLRIADALTVPLPERNTLLAWAPAFPAHELGSHAMEPVSRVLEKCCAATNPTRRGSSERH